MLLKKLKPRDSQSDNAIGEKGNTPGPEGSIFERLSEERQRNIEHEQQEPRTPLVRTLLLLTMTACLAAAITGFYGVYKFPDAPIRQHESGYVGRIGQPHTQEEFEGFLAWEKAMFLVFPAAFLFGISYAVAAAVQRRKTRS